MNIFDLKITLELDVSEYEKQLEIMSRPNSEIKCTRPLNGMDLHYQKNPVAMGIALRQAIGKNHSILDELHSGYIKKDSAEPLWLSAMYVNQLMEKLAEELEVQDKIEQVWALLLPFILMLIILLIKCLGG